MCVRAIILSFGWHCILNLTRMSRSSSGSRKKLSTARTTIARRRLPRKRSFVFLIQIASSRLSSSIATRLLRDGGRFNEASQPQRSTFATTSAPSTFSSRTTAYQPAPRITTDKAQDHRVALRPRLSSQHLWGGQSKSQGRGSKPILT